MAMAEGKNTCSTTSSLGVVGGFLGLDALCEENVAQKVAKVISKDPQLVTSFIKRQWPKVDRYVWLYMFLSIVAIGICSFCIFSLVCILQWLHRKVPPLKDWLKSLSQCIGELNNAVDSAAEESIGLSSDTINGAAEEVTQYSLRGSFERVVDSLADAFTTVEQKWGIPIK